jgi:hypothetical protein
VLAHQTKEKATFLRSQPNGQQFQTAYI